MKTFLLLSQLALFLSLVSCSTPEAPRQDSSAKAAPPSLTGVWYAGGDHTKPCSISETAQGLSAKNESGRISKITTDPENMLTAADWHGVRGIVQKDRIFWSNETWWDRNTIW